MDIFLMMAWRDARLVNPYKKAILVKEEEILEKIWRPDPFFANAKEASFHEVTFLNFLMRIFNDGLVLYETRYYHYFELVFFPLLSLKLFVKMYFHNRKYFY